MMVLTCIVRGEFEDTIDFNVKPHIYFPVYVHRSVVMMLHTTPGFDSQHGHN